MRIVVTGKTGQLAQSLQERGPLFGAEIVPLGRPEFDLADVGRSLDLLSAARPDLIVSAAAYTAVDKAESEPKPAYAVNAEGPRALSAAAAAGDPDFDRLCAVSYTHLTLPASDLV